MYRIPQGNISSARLPVEPHPTEPHPTSQRNDYLGRTLQYAPVTEKILLAYRDVTTAVQMKNWDIARVPGWAFSSADFIARNNLNPADAEKYFGLLGLTPDGYEYLKDGAKYLERQQKQQQNAYFLNRMSSLPEELCSSSSPIQQSTSSDPEIVVHAQTQVIEVSRRITICAIVYNILASEDIRVIDFCELNDLNLFSFYRRLINGTCSPSMRTKRSVFKLFGVNYENVMKSLLNALENVNTDQYFSLDGKVEIGILNALLCELFPQRIKSNASTEGASSVNQRRRRQRTSRLN